MDYYQAQDFFKQMYPGKNISFEFDEKCHRFHNIVYTDGNPNILHHVENNKLKVTVEGMDPVYIPIMPHRETYAWADIKKMINGKSDVFIHDEQLSVLNDLKDKNEAEFESALDEISRFSGLTKEKIQEKASKFSNAKKANE